MSEHAYLNVDFHTLSNQIRLLGILCFSHSYVCLFIETLKMFSMYILS